METKTELHQTDNGDYVAIVHNDYGALLVCFGPIGDIVCYCLDTLIAEGTLKVVLTFPECDETTYKELLHDIAAIKQRDAANQ